MLFRSLLGIAGVNSLLFASYGLSKRIVTPFGELSLPQIALAGAMAGAANAVLASPGEISVLSYHAIWGYLSTPIYSRNVQGSDARPIRVSIGSTSECGPP